ncbi:hypothetical protein DL771_011041 [Monosporascus sp. 5C6A]|nr:hypothetical protein DL771_011041 [Monosporascus sp. 5C6A]
MSDLEEAISVAREAVDATPQDHPDRAARLNNLGNRLGDRYSRTGAMSDLEEAIGMDLEEAIRVAREAVDATPQDHPDRAGWLNNLGNRLGDRYSRTGAMSDLEEAIGLVREALDATPQDHPDRAGGLNNLGVLLSDRYSRTGAMSDLEEAIGMVREAVDATPQDHLDRARILNNLGVRLDNKYLKTGAMPDLKEANKCFSIALNLDVSPVSNHIAAGRRLLSSPTIFQNVQKAYEIAQTTIQLIPLLAPRSLQNTDKQHLLSQAAGLASDAAAVTLQASKGSVAAIEMLETGRGILIGTLYDMRTDFSALQRQYPELARSFIDLRDKLDTPISRTDTLIATEDPTTATRAETNQRREASRQLDTLIDKIRRQPGFGRFLLPPSEAEMRKAAINGPIVIINVSPHRCDALIIEPSGIRMLELSRLSRKDIEDRDYQSFETIVWLWDTVVYPVLDALGFIQTPSDGCWPRVWWIPTGPLVRFPLHAAGNHLSRGSDTALDRVISSYSSSIRAIMHGRQQRRQEVTVNQNIALVAMKDTPGLGQGQLKFADDEASALAGFRHVIGTLWSVDDRLCVDMARITYGVLRDEGISDKAVSGGLHRATRELRDQWVQDVDATRREESQGSSQLQNPPYSASTRTTMPDESRLDRVYARLMLNHPYGWALYKKITTKDVRPGYCGYFDPDSDWHTLVDLTSPAEELAGQGWQAPDVGINNNKVPESMIWGPKSSSSVRTRQVGGTVGTTAAVAPIEASVTISFENECDNGAVLATQNPVLWHRIDDEAAALQWMADNTSEMLSRHKSIIKRHGIWIVTKTYTTRRCAVAIMTSRSSAVEIGLSANIQGLLALTPTSSWTTGEGNHCTEVHEDEEGVVVFISGIYFCQNMLGSKLKHARDQSKQERKLFRGGFVESDDEETEIELDAQYYPPFGSDSPNH